MATRRDLVDQALRDLGVLPANAAPSAADVATVDAKVDGTLERLDSLGIVSVPDPSDIDDRLFNPLAICLADACKSEFGVAAVDVAAAEYMLRRLMAVGPDYSVAAGEYF